MTDANSELRKEAFKKLALRKIGELAEHIAKGHVLALVAYNPRNHDNEIVFATTEDLDEVVRVINRAVVKKRNKPADVESYPVRFGTRDDLLAPPATE